MKKKYVKLSDDHMSLASAIFSEKPASVRRHPDERLPEFHWFVAEEHYTALPDDELYKHERASWGLSADDVVHLYYEPVLVPLEQRREIVKARCHEFRNARLAGGITLDTNRFDTMFETKMRVTGLVIKAMQSSAFSSDFITEDNTTVTLSAQDIIALGDAFARFEAEQVFYARQLKDQIMISDTPETFDYTVGWPSNVFSTTQTA